MTVRTTQNLDTTPDEKVREVQQKLNEKGYTDKFGEPLKEDGVLGGKTFYAYDTYSATNNRQPTQYEISTQKYRDAGGLTSRGESNRTVNEKLKLSYSDASVKPMNYNLMDKELSFESLSSLDDNMFNYNTRLSYSQTYNPNVETLQNRLVELGYLDMSSGGWGYYGPKTLDAVNRYKREKGLGNTGNDAGVVGKDTWESLGLICRTKKDVDAGVRVVTVGTHQFYDLTYAVYQALRTSIPEFEKHKNDNLIDKMIWFANQVGNNGNWNIKRDKSVWEETLNISSDSFEKKFFFYGNYIGKEALGNITYGYLGKVVGLADFALLGGSMANDLGTHFGTNLKNELVDHIYIKKGIDLYNGKDIREYLGNEV